MTDRKYLPTIGDLVDRLSIALLKSIYVPDRDAYREEIKLIRHDIEMLGFDDDLIYAVQVNMLANRVIWENEAAVRSEGRDANRLWFTHSINGVRTLAKNLISAGNGERIDSKVDCLAAGIPPEFGNWHVFD